jgi:hypothetical protein
LPLTSNLGLPLFTAEGKVLGVAVMQTPDEGMDESPAAMFSRMATLQEMMSGLILPADEVVEATRRALEVADKPADAEPGSGDGAEAGSLDPDQSDQDEAPIGRPAPAPSDMEDGE